MCSILLALLLALPATLVAQAPAKGDTPAGETYTVECTFHNPAFAGPCAVSEKVSEKLTPREACTTILSCLNDSRCLKTYCNATTVRGGWTLVKAERRAEGAPSDQAPAGVRTRPGGTRPGSVTLASPAGRGNRESSRSGV